MEEGQRRGGRTERRKTAAIKGAFVYSAADLKMKDLYTDVLIQMLVDHRFTIKCFFKTYFDNSPNGVN